ncbi:MAG: hypothetical protein FWE69_02500, partial [Clostridiales bacterium]|nr:hypothetical protein [Clostridiales bacterium]
IDRVTVFDIDGTTILSQDITANGIALLNQVAAATATVIPGAPVLSAAWVADVGMPGGGYFSLVLMDGATAVPVSPGNPDLTITTQGLNVMTTEWMPVGGGALLVNPDGQLICQAMMLREQLGASPDQTVQATLTIAVNGTPSNTLAFVLPGGSAQLQLD